MDLTAAIDKKECGESLYARLRPLLVAEIKISIIPFEDIPGRIGVKLVYKKFSLL